jgi:hypothetical protein
MSGILIRKASGGEWARFLEEESEPRNKMIFLAGENHRPDVSACQTFLFHPGFENACGHTIFFDLSGVLL